jgi:hypothetical protein
MMPATTVLLLAASLFGFVPPAVAPSADLSVDLQARSGYILPSAYYTVTVTNHGPDAIESATVVVTLPERVLADTRFTCVVDATTQSMTCPFGPLAAGSSATATTLVYYVMGGDPRNVTATANRTASTPSDPDPGNDTATTTCRYTGPSGIPPSPWPPLMC